MLVLTRKTDEVVTIDKWMHVVPTEILETQMAVTVHAVRPFQADVGFANTVRFPVPSTSFEFVLNPGQTILIGEDITVVFIVARNTGPNSEPRARIGFEAPSRTKLCAKDAGGSIVTEFEFGKQLQRSNDS